MLRTSKRCEKSQGAEFSARTQQVAGNFMWLRSAGKKIFAGGFPGRGGHSHLFATLSSRTSSARRRSSISGEMKKAAEATPEDIVLVETALNFLCFCSIRVQMKARPSIAQMSGCFITQRGLPTDADGSMHKFLYVCVTAEDNVPSRQTSNTA